VGNATAAAPVVTAALVGPFGRPTKMFTGAFVVFFLKERKEGRKDRSTFYLMTNYQATKGKTHVSHKKKSSLPVSLWHEYRSKGRIERME
jgi:hypothetical protein